MIDIHCHLLCGVDDGAKSLEESQEMLKIAASQNINKIILTPHRRHGMFAYPVEAIDNQYKILKECGQKLGVELYLGTEYHVDSDMVNSFKSGTCHTLAGGRYILTEYSHASEYTFIKTMTKEALHAGYIPVIAHIERYECVFDEPELAGELQNIGALVQINADAVLGNDGRAVKKFCKKLLKNELVDIVASDSHNTTTRVNNMAKCYEYIAKKYDRDYADLLFNNNPEKIILNT